MENPTKNGWYWLKVGLRWRIVLIERGLMYDSTDMVNKDPKPIKDLLNAAAWVGPLNEPGAYNSYLKDNFAWPRDQHDLDMEAQGYKEGYDAGKYPYTYVIPFLILVALVLGFIGFVIGKAV
jgi:hypothetical protein